MIGENLKCRQSRMDEFAKQQNKHKPWNVDLQALNKFLDGGKKPIRIIDELLAQFTVTQHK